MHIIIFNGYNAAAYHAKRMLNQMFAMKSRTTFRILLLILFAMTMAGPFIPSGQTLGGLDHDDMHRLSSEGYRNYGILLNTLLRFGVLTAILYIASIIGLWLFWSPARTLFAVTYALVVALTDFPFSHVDGHWWRVAIDIWELLVTGSVMLLMWSSPVKKAFERASGEPVAGGYSPEDGRKTSA